MRVRFAGAAARAIGFQQAALSLETPMTVGEVMTILRNLYPGFGRLDYMCDQGLRVCLNHVTVTPDSSVTNDDLLEISAPVSLFEPGRER